MSNILMYELFKMTKDGWNKKKILKLLPWLVVITMATTQLRLSLPAKLTRSRLISKQSLCKNYNS